MKLRRMLCTEHTTAKYFGLTAAVECIARARHLCDGRLATKQDSLLAARRDQTFLL